ncbi:gamma-mobile-trio recombinase GmtY [Pseudomonas atacamensis]|uniref:gamma-mobile-trio recombinase GmtY n=1 Tax=Pseudomonas atacamensis TaxID=2565368 RepID=UPI00300EC950
MPVVEAYAKVVVDNSGFRSEIPVLLTEKGVILPLLNYLLKNTSTRSHAWQHNVVVAAKLLLEYLEANQANFSSPTIMFQSFANCLYSGSVGDDGLDPSGLYWIPASVAMTHRHITALKGLTDYLADHEGAPHMNPLVTATSYDQRLHYAAWFRRNEHDFLGHIKDKTVNETVQRARNVQVRRKLSATDDDAIAFPERLFERFYLEGVGGAQDRRCAVRDQLILIMMHGASVRESEPLQLWIQDVTADPHDSKKAIVRLYHPADGKAPDDWKSRTGKSTRSAYLRENFALASRNRMRGTRAVGWKVRLHDHVDYYIQLHWFPTDFGRLFLKLWKEHLFYLASVERHHPFAFVSYERGSLGKPYTLNAFNKNYAAAMARIGLATSKVEGRSPHGHRHAYGRRLTRAGVDPVIRKKAMHHASLESQTVYTALNMAEVSQALDDASKLLDEPSEGSRLMPSFSNWEDIMKTGFEDVDPTGLMSGPNAKLRSV